MKKSYLVLVNDILFDRKLTRAGAQKVVDRLKKEKGLSAVIAYEVNGKYEPMPQTLERG